MFDYRFNKLIKKSKISTSGRISFVECGQAAKLARAIRTYNVSTDNIIVCPGDGYGLIRMSEAIGKDTSSFIRREESGVLRNGQAGFVVNLSKLNQALA